MKYFGAFWALALFLGLTSQSVLARTSMQRVAVSQQSVEAIEELVESHFRAGLFEGSVLVAAGDHILFHQAYGLADRTWGIKNRTDTRFHIGSVGKQMTGAIILQLVEEGKLNLDATLSDVLPAYPAEYASTLPVRTLFNHTSGIPNYTRMPEFQRQSGSPISRDDLQALFSEKPLDFEPGTRFSYNNSAFFLASRIIEEVEGKPYSQVVTERLFEPLGLQDTGYIDDRRVIPNFAEAYNWGGLDYVAEVQTHESWIVGNAMIYSDTDDLFRWTRALLAGELFKSDETLRMLVDLPEGSERNYSFGLGNVPLAIAGESYRGMGHSGALGGFRSAQKIVVEREWTVIVLCNVGMDQNTMADNILRLLGGEEVESALPPVSRQVGVMIGNSDFQTVSHWFEEELVQEPLSYDFDEGGMNNLGYAFLESGDTRNAISIFQLNTVAHPESSNVFDSLGEAYFAAGKMELSYRSYSKAVELDPKNTNAVAKVEELRAKIGIED